jgi:hypothetical protein
MVANLLYFVGLVCILLGVLNLIGVFVFGTLGGVGLLVLGAVLLLAAYFFAPGTYTRSGRRGL